MFGGLLLVGAIALVLGCARTPVDVTLLAINDFHGALGDTGSEPVTGRPWGGGIALAAHVRAERLAAPRATLLLDAGDAWQGTLASNLSYGRATVAYLNRLGVDAAALGNHEFDWGIDTLRARLREMHFPMLAANVVQVGGTVPAWSQGTAVIDRDGVRLGVIGFITPETPQVTLPQNVASLRFRPPEGEIDSLVALVRSQGADLVVLLCHLGAWQDSTGVIRGPLAALAQRARGVDAVVGAHTHTYVAGHVAGIPVVVAGTKGRGLGKIVLHWDGRRVRGSDVTWTPVFADSLPALPDPAVVAFVDSVCRVTAPRAERVLAHTSRRLDGETLARFVATAMCGRVHADVAVTNIGGIRTEFAVGSITEADVFALVPFENTLVTARLRGEALRDFIASGAGKARCVGQEIAPGREYLVVTNNFLASGGDGFAGFLAGRDLTWTEHRVRDVVRQALEDGGPAGLGSGEPAGRRKRAETSRGGRSLRSVKSE